MDVDVCEDLGVNIEGLHLIFFFSRQSLSVNLGLTDLARLLSSKVRGILLQLQVLLQLQMLGLAVPSLYVNGSLDTHEDTLS